MDPAMVNAASDTVIGLAVGIPVIVVAGGVTLALRLRRRPKSDAVAPEATKTRPAGRATPPAEASVEAAPPVEVVEPAEVLEPAEVAEVVEAATYRSRMGKARGLLSGYLGSVRAKSKIDAATWDDLEEALIRADVGVGATDALLDDLRTRVKAGEISGANALIDALKGDLVATLSATSAGLAEPGPEASLSDAGDSDEGRSVDVWLFVCVNGVGKTTTVGKVAGRLAGDGNR
ncbi:MAG: signal recognition particle receptor subunit alpha, partial [Acidimicrobiales bacterium]